MKAWVLYYDNLQALIILAATTRGKAIATALHSAREAGYQAVWGDFKARRCPLFDDLASTTNCQPYPLGYHARSYDLCGDFTGWSQFGCLEGYRINPKQLYEIIG